MASCVGSFLSDIKADLPESDTEGDGDGNYSAESLVSSASCLM